VTAIQRGGIADQLHGELQEGIVIHTTAFTARSTNIVTAIPNYNLFFGKSGFFPLNSGNFPDFSF